MMNSSVTVNLSEESIQVLIDALWLEDRFRWRSFRHCNAEFELHIILSGSCVLDVEGHVHPRGGYLNDMFLDFDDVARGYGHARYMGRVVAAGVLQAYDKVNIRCLRYRRGNVTGCPRNSQRYRPTRYLRLQGGLLPGNMEHCG